MADPRRLFSAKLFQSSAPFSHIERFQADWKRRMPRPRPARPYLGILDWCSVSSHHENALAVSRTGLAFVSGLIGQARDTGELVSAELRPQAEAMFDNLATLLTEIGVDARATLQTTLYLTSYDDFAEINTVYRERMSEPYPARVTLQVVGLPLGARVQIDAVVEASART